MKKVCLIAATVLGLGIFTAAQAQTFTITLNLSGRPDVVVVQKRGHGHDYGRWQGNHRHRRGGNRFRYSGAPNFRIHKEEKRVYRNRSGRTDRRPKAGFYTYYERTSPRTWPEKRYLPYGRHGGGWRD